MNRKLWHFFLPLGILLVLIAAFWVGLQRNPGEVPSPLIGKPAPAFTLPDLHDPTRTVTQDIFAGHVSLFNVWGSWCPGCREEHALLLEFARESGVPVYGLNWMDDRNAALEWLARLGNPYAVTAFDASGRTGVDWGVYGAPETFVIDARGIVRYKHIGPLDANTLYGRILPFIRELEKEGAP